MKEEVAKQYRQWVEDRRRGLTSEGKIARVKMKRRYERAENWHHVFSLYWSTCSTLLISGCVVVSMDQKVRADEAEVRMFPRGDLGENTCENDHPESQIGAKYRCASLFYYESIQLAHGGPIKRYPQHCKEGESRRFLSGQALTIMQGYRWWVRPKGSWEEEHPVNRDLLQLGESAFYDLALYHDKAGAAVVQRLEYVPPDVIDSVTQISRARATVDEDGRVTDFGIRYRPVGYTGADDEEFERFLHGWMQGANEVLGKGRWI